MTDGWFAGVESGDEAAAAERIRTGRADGPEAWPQQAVDAGFASDEDDYYDQLHAATMTATRAAVAERETADDKQLVHAIRAMADCERTANELAERVAEWAGSRYGESGSGVDFARDVVEREPVDEGDVALQSLAERTVAVADEADDLRTYIEQTAPAVAPNLSALAGPVLAARLVSLAGGLESLAKQPSGTVQVLGAEDALFAHLRGGAPSPKHGIIFTHEYVSGTRPEERGSAARALAGKLSIAARVDHYSGDLRPDLEAELDERIERIRTRGGDGE
ncbi:MULTISPECIES: NOP5/NOP56 family protein [Haloarcula]|uniref:Nucleolar n=1 Tax=Haloarcula pellucida TaxID=1427151 RepID=A0A830GJU5_9EURY|nr:MULTISPECIES: NOP5/NOP56 family protein [Halomicroarcula]MBX0347207.1 NOP58 family protein [Halomicroarcula pellucida]MDS0276917.1 NOP58 family protein [Halomicroarcula sp. S1AR25-4]GGN87507.1 nucleolar [Halomicroarcula pellucida]